MDSLRSPARQTHGSMVLLALALLAAAAWPVQAAGPPAGAAKPNDAVTLKEAARIHAEKRDYRQAADAWKAVVEMEPENAEHYTQWIQYLGNCRAYGEQIAAYEAFFSRFPDMRRHHASGLMYAYRNNNQVDKAIELGLEFARQVPRRGYAYRDVARLCQQAKEYDRALEYYGLAVRKADSARNRERWQMETAELLIERDKPVEATVILTNLVAMSGDTYTKDRANRLHLQVLEKTGRWEDYVASLTAQLEREPSNQGVLRQLAEVYRQRNRYDAAAEAWGKLVALNPSQENYEQWIHSFNHAKAWPGEVAAYEAFLEKYPDRRASQLSGLMSAYQRNNQLDKALQVGEEAARANARDGYAYYDLASVCRQAEALDKAVSYYQKAVEHTRSLTNKDRWQMAAAEICVRQKKYDEALGVLRRLASDSKDSYVRSQAMRQIVEILKKTGKLDEHLAQLEKQAEADPENKALVHQLADIYTDKNTYGKAAEYWGKLCALEPNESNYSRWVQYLGYAKAYADQVAAYEAFLERFPDQRANHLSSLMHAYQNNGQIKKAIEVGEAAAEQDPRNGYSYRDLASACERAKAYDKAVRYYEKAVALSTSESNRQRWQVDTLEALSRGGMTAEALERLKPLMPTLKDPHVRSRAERLLLDLLAKEKGLDAYLADLLAEAESDPASVAVLKRIVQIRIRQRNYPECSKIWRKICSIEPKPEHYNSLIQYQGYARTYPEQVASYEELFETFPDQKRQHIRGYLTACQQARQMSKLIAAAKDYVALSDRKDGHTHREAARVFRGARLFKEAMEYLEAALPLAKNKANRQAWQIELCEIYHAAGDDSRAVTALEALLKDAPDSRTERKARELLRTVGRTRERNAYIDGLKEKADADPSDADAQKELAEAYRTTGQFADAAEYYRKALAVREDADTYSDLAYACRASGKHDEAIAAYQKILEKSTDPMQRDYTAKAIVELYVETREGARALAFIDSVQASIRTPFVKNWMAKQAEDLKE